MSASAPQPPYDATVALLADPYRLISEQCPRLGTDGFETHVLFKATTCLKGTEAAALFYDPERFKREGAMPSPIRTTLLGEGGVQGLDGDRPPASQALHGPDGPRAHPSARRSRSRAMDAPAHVGPQRTGIFVSTTNCTRCSPARSAPGRRRRSKKLMFSVARQLRALFDAGGARSPRYLWSRYARRKEDRWLKGVIESVREGRHRPAEDTPTFRIAHARDLSGDLLPAEVAAVELANVLRPTVATAVYVVFLAHALHLHPEAARAAGESAAERIAFLQEVRRFYAFFPSLIARTRRPFTWRGLTFPADRQVILDLHTQAKIGPYELQDFNLYYLTRYGLRPSKVAFLAWHAWRTARRATGRRISRPTRATPMTWPRSNIGWACSCSASSRSANSSARPCRTAPR